MMDSAECLNNCVNERLVFLADVTAMVNTLFAVP